MNASMSLEECLNNNSQLRDQIKVIRDEDFLFMNIMAGLIFALMGLLFFLPVAWCWAWSWGRLVLFNQIRLTPADKREALMEELLISMELQGSRDSEAEDIPKWLGGTGRNWYWKNRKNRKDGNAPEIERGNT
jgi:hypothetical protein